MGKAKLNTDTDWTIEFTIEGAPEPVRLVVEDEMLIGRTDASHQTLNGLDLADYDGKDQGVSRQHALIRWDGDNLVIKDLKSANGTILNAMKLPPEVEYRLNDGDQLSVGHLSMSIRINDVGWSTIRARRVEFSLRGAPVKARGQRILVVEDDSSFAAMYKATFEKSGYNVQTCREVVSAIRALNSNSLSLIILDLMLPSIYGLELCRYVRRDTDNPDLPIVVISAASEPSIISQAMEAGADVFISKPINIKEVSRVVSALIFQAEAGNSKLSTKQLSDTAVLQNVSEVTATNTIILFIQNYREPVGLVVDNQVVLGRRLSSLRGQQYLDLEEYGAFDKGVSRTHAKLVREDDSFFVEDLGSSNGTFVNGTPIGANKSYSLTNGDELRLGDLCMTVYLLRDDEQHAASSYETSEAG